MKCSKCKHELQFTKAWKRMFNENYSDFKAERIKEDKENAYSQIPELLKEQSELDNEYAELLEAISKKCPDEYMKIHTISNRLIYLKTRIDGAFGKILPDITPSPKSL